MLKPLNPIQVILDDYPAIILDGALATELEAHGCDLDDPLWSARVLLEDPQAIVQVHKEYFEKGADVAITSSYQASIEGFAEQGIEEKEALMLIRKTVELAKQAREDFWDNYEKKERPKPLVAASVGPYGAYLADGSEYVGNYGVTDERLADFHRPRIQALLEAGADLLALETIPSLQEAKVLASLLKEYPDIYAWLSFTLKDGETISDGTSFQQCVEFFNDDEQIAAIGINCSPVSASTEAVRVAGGNTNKPIIVYPNSGEMYDAETNSWSGESERFEYQAEQWYGRGARIIGGCCRTTPQHIEELAKRLRG